MGYLFCRQDGEDYLINDAVGISRGGETYVSMTPDDLAKIEQLEKDHPEDFLGGWFHTHPGLSPFFSDTDIQNQMFYQAQNEDGLGIVFDHSMVDTDFIGFKIFRLDDAQDPTTEYHEVPWKPVGWTEKGLEEALQPLGVSIKIIKRLAYKLGLRATPPKPELPPFKMPNVPDKKTASNMMTKIEENSQKAYEKGDYLQGLMTKRVQISLIKKFEDDEELLGDELIRFAEWALESDRFLSAQTVVEELELMNEDGDFPPKYQNYYLAKTNYLWGLIYKKQFRYSNAIESFEECIPPYEAEDIYDEECANASEHIATCYEKQKEYKKAVDWIEKAESYAASALKFARDNAENEQDREEIVYLEEYLTDLQKYEKRLTIMKKAVSSGPQRVV